MLDSPRAFLVRALPSIELLLPGVDHRWHTAVMRDRNCRSEVRCAGVVHFELVSRGQSWVIPCCELLPVSMCAVAQVWKSVFALFVDLLPLLPDNLLYTLRSKLWYTVVSAR